MTRSRTLGYAFAAALAGLVVVAGVGWGGIFGKGFSDE
jgi:hypothetical protein